MQNRSIYIQNPDWLLIGGSINSNLSATIYSRLVSRINNGDFSWDNIGYIQDLNLKAAGPALNIDQQTLEKLRRACQLWNVDIQLKEIKSHRKVVGFFIVAAKRLIFPILKAFMKDTLRQQRAFNAAILAITLDLYEKSAKQPQNKHIGN